MSEKGKVAGNKPSIVELEAGKSYAWCSCGMSGNQPFCDGSHKGSGFKPMVIKVDEPKKVAFCVCKQTNNPPYCDGSHNKL